MSEKLPAPREGLSGKAMRRVVMGSLALLNKSNFC